MSEPAYHAMQPRRPRGLTGNGLLGVWHAVESGYESAFSDWYDRQHHLERVGVPGFLRARRYLNVEGARFLCRYDVEESAVLASPAYLAALNHPTEWTRSLMPHYRDTTRAVFRFVASAGDAEGGWLVSLRLPDPASAVDAIERVRGELAAVAAESGVLRAELWQADIDASTLRTEEKRLRAAADAIVAAAVLVEGSDLDRVSAAVAKRVMPLVPSAVVDRYRLVFQLAAH